MEEETLFGHPKSELINVGKGGLMEREGFDPLNASVRGAIGKRQKACA